MTSSEYHYFISHVIGETPENREVDTWPLHMTVVPPFRLLDDANEHSIAEAITQAGSAIGPIELKFGEPIRSGAIILEVGDTAQYGANGDVSVVKIIDISGKLRVLHSHLMKSVRELSKEFINLNPEWVYDNYSPHATTKSGAVLDRPFICDTLTIHRTDRQLGKKALFETVDLIQPTKRC